MKLVARIIFSRETQAITREQNLRNLSIRRAKNLRERNSDELCFLF